MTHQIERFSSFLRREKDRYPELKIFDAALNAYRAWNVREKGAIIDFDLTAGPGDFEQVTRRFTQPAPSKEDRLEMVGVLTELISELNLVTPVSDSSKHDIDFAAARLEASYWFANRLAEEEIDPKEYLDVTNEVVRSIEESFLRSKKEALLELAEVAHMPIHSIKQMQNWRVENKLDEETAQRLLRESARDALSAIQSFTDEAVDLQYRVNPVESEQYFYAWSRTDYKTGEFVCDQNFHRSKIWTPGKAEELAVHEIAEHLRRNNDWRKQIKKGNMHPFIGQTVVHGPEAVVEEGLALTLAHFVPDIYESLSPEGKFQVDASILRYMVWGNVHIILNSPEGLSEEDATQYVRKFIPWEPKDEIRRQIFWRTKHPTYQVYLLSYAIGARLFLEIIDSLNIKGRKQLLTDLSRKAYTPTQLVNRAAELANRKKTKNSGVKTSVAVGALNSLI